MGSILYPTPSQCLIPPSFSLSLSLSLNCTAPTKGDEKDMFKNLVISNFTSASHTTTTTTTITVFYRWKIKASTIYASPTLNSASNIGTPRCSCLAGQYSNNDKK